MARPSNLDHVRRVLRALSILRTEPGWHSVEHLAQTVGAKPARLADDLRRACYAAGELSLPLMFGDDLEPEHPDGSNVVQFNEHVAVQLPLPPSRVALARMLLASESAIAQDFDVTATNTLAAVRDRIVESLGISGIDGGAAKTPDVVVRVRNAIGNSESIQFAYQGLEANEPRVRVVQPESVSRSGSGWVLMGIDLSLGEERTFRLDRVIGEIDSASPAEQNPESWQSRAEPNRGVGSSVRQEVRLRIDANEIWAVENYDPRIAEEVDGRVEVTVLVYPPVGARLSRLLMFLGPSAEVLDGEEVLQEHRARVRQLQQVYRK